MLLDLKSFVDASVAGIPLIAVVMGLVTWVSQAFGLQGRWLLVVSMLIGLVLGGAFQVSQALPVDFAGWFAVVIYGLALGLIASGVYDTAKKLSRK